MTFEPFVMERWQSEWENRVRHNLSESGVHAMKVGELVGAHFMPHFSDQELVYGHSNGTVELREAIAGLYAGAQPDQVLVTNGSAEANFIAAWRLIQPDDEVVIVLPNYMQLPGIARSFGATVVPVRLREDAGWVLDLDALGRAVSPRTRLIAVCNPNNPTGSVLTEREMEGVVAVAAREGAWLLADEIYRGAEREGPETGTFWGSYDRLLVTCGLSKAYGLPGLRIGWVVSAAGMSEALWARKDYTSIFPGVLSDLLARRALAMRERILQRTRGILRNNYPVLARWLASRRSLFSLVEPRAGAIAFVRYTLAVNSTQLACRLKDEESVLVVPGDQFGMDGYLRIGFGNERDDLEAALPRIDAFVHRLVA